MKKEFKQIGVLLIILGVLASGCASRKFGFNSDEPQCNCILDDDE